MVRRWILTTATAVGLAMSSLPARAGGVPTIDVAAIAQQIANLMENIAQTETAGKQLTELGRQLTELYDMGRTLDAELAAITGGRVGIADILKGDMDSLANRDELFTQMMRWRDISSPTGIAAEIKAAAERYAVLEGGTLFPDRASGTPDVRAQFHDESTNAVLVSLATSERAFDDSTAAMDRLSRLREEIGRTQDLQDSIALNSRIMVEVGVLLAQQQALTAAQGNVEARRYNAQLRQFERSKAGRRPIVITQD